MELEISNPLETAMVDQGPFIKMGTMFTCNKSKWAGVVVASPLAIYLLKIGEVKAGRNHGLIGIMIAEAFSKKADQMRTCTLSALPPIIRFELDPKTKTKLDSKDVIIVPRDTVSFAKSSKWNNTVEITAGTDKFRIDTHILSFRAIPRGMEENGWQFNVALTPTAEAMHDLRTPEEVAKNAEPTALWKRVLYVTGAVVVFVLFVVAKAYLHHP